MIIQSHHKPRVFTDSKPCIQAVQKLQKGEFSASARLSAFLSSVSQYQAELFHISGENNLVADYASRHPLPCTAQQCAVCKFVAETMQSIIRAISVEDILEGKASLPYTNRNTWIAVQQECDILRKVSSYKQKGTIPSRKSKNLKTVRKYISANIIRSSDGLLTQPKATTFGSVIDRIVVPEQVLHGILTVLHLQLRHPSANNLSKAFSRYFFALNLEKCIKEVSKSCHQCASIKEIPHAMIEQSTDPPPQIVGERFAADVIKRNSQKIFIIRESVTSYTLGELINDEKANTVADVLVRQCNLLRPSTSHKIIVRLDPHPSHQSLFKSLQGNDKLAINNISIELGRVLNKNKNPVIDKACKELIREILIEKPEGGQLSTTQLSKVIASLNCRYRRNGLSSQELWTQRDHNTGEQLPIKDREIIVQQHQARIENHFASQKSKAHGKPFRPKAHVEVGTLVYVINDRDKLKARQRYLVTNIDGDKVKLRRFTQTLFRGAEYDAHLREIYRVPYLDRENLQDIESDSSDDDFNIDLPVSNPSTAKKHTDRDRTLIKEPRRNVDDHASSDDSTLSDYDQNNNTDSETSDHNSNSETSDSTVDFTVENQGHDLTTHTDRKLRDRRKIKQPDRLRY